jgi:hypothetical protein
MADVPMPKIAPVQAGDNYLFYEGAWQMADVANLDKVFNNIGGLLSKGEAAINKELTDSSKIDPGQLDQSRLLQAQVNLSRWQLASQLLSNFASGIASGLKNTVQNVGR